MREIDEEIAGKKSDESNGNPMIYIYIALGVVIIILLAVILGLLIQTMKERRKITVTENVRHGRSSDPDQYYNEMSEVG